MRRVSRDRLVVAVWDAVARSPGYAALAALLEQHLGAETAAELRAPFLGGEDELRALFAAAGMAEVSLRRVEGTVRFPSLATWLRSEIRGWTLAERIDDAQFAALERAAPAALGHFVSASGEVAFPVFALLLDHRYGR